MVANESLSILVDKKKCCVIQFVQMLAAIPDGARISTTKNRSGELEYLEDDLRLPAGDCSIETNALPHRRCPTSQPGANVANLHESRVAPGSKNQDRWAIERCV